jgi:hypothetical protein
MIQQHTWKRFGDLLHARLNAGAFTTEDSVRYTFFAALLEGEHLKPEEIVLEFRHPTIADAEIDTWVPNLRGVATAIEFKYDRDFPSGKNSPRTQKVGKVFHDLYRLGQLDSTAKRFFVYLASSEMTKHFMSERNRLTEFFGLKPGLSLRIDADFCAGRAKTFLSVLGTTPNVEALAVYSRSLPHDHELRAFEIKSIDR